MLFTVLLETAKDGSRDLMKPLTQGQSTSLRKVWDSNSDSVAGYVCLNPCSTPEGVQGAGAEDQRASEVLLGREGREEYDLGVPHC